MGLQLDEKRQAMMRLFMPFRRGRGTVVHSELQDFLPSEAFGLELEKERARADRSENPFTMLSFELNQTATAVHAQEGLNVLAEVLNARTRLIDTKGWFNDQLSIILPFTPSEHGIRVWRSIQETFYQALEARLPDLSSTKPPELSCRIYAYPKHATVEVDEVARADAYGQMTLPEMAYKIYAYPANGR